jgi:mRNA interferase HigB
LQNENNCIIFVEYKISKKGNDYRLVAIVLFARDLATVCFIGTHAEYDKINCLTVLQM